MKTDYHLPLLLIRLHTIAICMWIVLATTVLGFLAICCSFFSRTGNSVHLIARFWGKTILWVSGIRVTAIGLDRIRGLTSCIFMSNHQSNFDIPVLLSHLPKQFRWLAKAELFKIPIFGRSMSGAGYISIDRSDRTSAFESLARAAETIRNGTSVMIFPEGTRSKDGRLLPYKKGGFVMAVDAQVPIVPIVIEGTHEIMPKGRLLIRPRPVTVTFCEKIDTRGFSRETKETVMDQVRQAMQAIQSSAPHGGSRA
ncbi:MAG: lysophospholipid acyltransferase family protein [Desulfobacteraceae bacterium]